MQFKDYYDTLGVAKSATAKEIKGAFRRLARKFHPDVNPGDSGAETRFKEINEAYEVLGDVENRKKYDELGANWRMYEQARSGSGQSPFTGGGGEYTWAGSSGGFRPMTEEEAAQAFGQGDSPFSDFFRTFFGGAGGRPFEGAEDGGGRVRRGRVRQGRDLEHPLELSLEDALNGSVQRLAIQQGPDTRSVEVRVPPGVTDGSRVRVSGEGERGGGAANGDLYLRVQLRPHERFRRDGRDLHLRVPLPLTTAVLGGEVDVQTLSGRTVRLKVPATTQNGQVFRLRGHGLPLVGNTDDRGDLYAAMDVRLPASVSPAARQHYEALAALEKQT